VNLHDVQAIEQIGPEASLLDLLLQVGIGRKDEAKVDRNFTFRTDGPDAAVFEHAQQLALHRQRQFTDFIEEQRAAMGIEEQALTPAVCAGEGSLEVARTVRPRSSRAEWLRS
jgi:hypothetical protein